MDDTEIESYTRNPEECISTIPRVSPAQRRAAELFRVAGTLPDDARKILFEPLFGKQRTADDWRNFIGDEVRVIWLDLLTDARAALFVTAEEYGRGWTFPDDE